MWLATAPSATQSGASTIARSGMALEEARLAASANNVANLNTVGYSAREVTAQSTADGGVSARTRATGQPTDLLQETITQMELVVAYTANLAVIRTSDQMSGTLLNTFV